MAAKLLRGKFGTALPPEPNLTDWTALIETNLPLWKAAKIAAEDGPNVLIATAVGGLSAISVLESLLAVALTLRGAKVHTLLCDQVLPACLRISQATVAESILENYQLPQVLCKNCFATGQYLFNPLGLTHHVFSQLLSEAERQQAQQISKTLPLGAIPTYQIQGWNIGEHAYAGALRYFASGNLENEPQSEIVVRRYLEGALLTAFATHRLLQTYNFQAACFNHGIYSPPGIIGEVCRAEQVAVANWSVAYRKRCFIFSHGDTYHHTLLDEPVETWQKMPWTEKAEQSILTYLKSRWQGTQDWIWFHEQPDEEMDRIAREIGLDLSKPIIGMLTNVMWDAQLHYRANAFPNMLSWVLQTLEYFSKRPDLQLLVRIHPAEIRGTMASRQPLLPEILKVWPELPNNIFIVPPESQVSTYAAMMHCDAVIIYGTKTGVELTSMGIPVIVGGEAWIRNKGITLDASSPEEYFQHLNKLPFGQRLDADTLQKARKYAYHFFFRRMIPIQCMEPVQSWPPYAVKFDNLKALSPGADPGLDIICDGILSGNPFIYPAEELGIELNS
ncbi:capsule biosynthesis protein [filamentous cyanobacterium CCP5]|nr:capsule biosynthesis protein [filamentous cyanobacterium CCP5]